MKLRPYQQSAVDAVYEHLRSKENNPCIVLPTGTGKSCVLAQIAKDAALQWRGRVLILAHVKELLEQNADKIRRLAPELKIGIFSAGLKCRDTDEQVIVAGIQSVYNKACELGSFDLIVVDECFPAGTLIETPRGEIPIEDLYVGQPVCHALGVGEIECISARPATEIIKLELSNGKLIECTPNHPFFTEYGWRTAETLEVGTHLYSKQDMQSMRENFSTASKNGRWEMDHQRRREQMVTTNNLLEKVYPNTAKSENRHLGERCGKRKEAMSLLRENNLSQVLHEEEWSNSTCPPKYMESDAILFHILLEESRESDVFAGNTGKSWTDIETNRTSPQNARREWSPCDSGTGYACEETRRDGSIRACHPDNGISAHGRSRILLQNRCGNSREENCDSTRWEQPSIYGNQGSRQTEKTVVSGIRVARITRCKLQNPRIVYNLQVKGHPSFFANGVLAHNCHLIAPDGDGMYRSFLNDMKIINPNVRLIGLTATPFRMKGGLICQSENLLNEICYEAGLKEMIQQGYLSPLVSKAGRAEAKLDDLHIRGGEFINDEIEAAMDQTELVSAACREIVELTRDCKAVLIFTCSVEHCQHVAEKITAYSGKECAIVTGSTPAAERAEIIARFKGEPVPDDFFTFKPPLKFLANVNVLTTGFDAPNTDCVVLLRPTNSAGLLIQMVGRGTRLCEGKSSCLVLDYGGNILRHGPVDMIDVKDRTAGNGDAPAKKCLECLALIHAAYQKCPECGHEFPPPEHKEITQNASTAGVISGQVDFTDYEVMDTFYALHEKRYADPGTPKTMRIDYRIGFNEFKSEWVCPEHSGYARDKFIKWWRERATIGCPVPTTANEAVAMANEGILAATESITVKTVAGEKFERITGWRLKQRPELPEGWPLMTSADWQNADPEIDDNDIPF